MNIQAHIDSINEVGYTILPDLISPAQIASVKTALAPWLNKTLMGRNNFEGQDSERVYALLAKLPALASLVEHPSILDIVDQFLTASYLLSANLAINIHPGETCQPFHADHAAVPNCDRAKINGISTIWAFDDFTEQNGATEVIPGSHLWTDSETHRDPKPKKMLMSAGSVLVFHGSLLHRGGANNADLPRLAITPQYCQPWLRQLENMSLAIPQETARQFSPRLQSLLGYSICPPGFMGYVDGLHPKRLLDPQYQGRKAHGLAS